MGVESYLLSADDAFPDRAENLNYNQLAIIGSDIKGIDTVKLSALFSIASNSEYDPGYLHDPSYMKLDGGEDGPWVFDCGEAFVTAIAALTNDKLPDVLEKWRKTEEFNNKYDPISAEDAQLYLETIVKECRQAKTRSWKLYLYVSL